MSHSSFFHDDSPSDSPVEQYHERSQPSGPGEMASTASNQTPLRPDFSRHDSPFDTPSRKQRRASGAHAERNYSPPRSSRRPGSRLSLRSAHHEVPDEDLEPLEPVLVHLRTNVVVSLDGINHISFILTRYRSKTSSNWSWAFPPPSASSTPAPRTPS